MHNYVLDFFRRWWLSIMLLGILLLIALSSTPAMQALSTYYYHIALPLVQR